MVRFSEAVVPFGDLRLPDPMTLACEGGVPAGGGRWASDRIWLYDFAAAAAARQPLHAAGEARLEAAERRAHRRHEFSFSTGGPVVLTLQP